MNEFSRQIHVTILINQAGMFYSVCLLLQCLSLMQPTSFHRALCSREASIRLNEGRVPSLFSHLTVNLSSVSQKVPE